MKVNPRVVVIGSPGDMHVRHLADCVGSKGSTPLVIDADWVRLHAWQAGVRLESKPYGVGRGIIRGLPIPDTHSLGSAEVSAWVEFAEGIANDPSVEWLTPLADLQRADNKLYQLRLAEQLGIRFPPTVIAPRRDILEQSLGRWVIIKALGSGIVPQMDGREAVFYTTLVDLTTVRDESIAIAPVIAQEYIKADKHLRIVTVRDQLWCASLTAQADYIDWREMRPELRRRWQITTIPSKLQEDASTIAQMAKVGFSCQDWLQAGNQFWFLELNPVGNWLFLPTPLATSVTHALTHWLLSQDQ
jgi:hypothetical protein